MENLQLPQLGEGRKMEREKESRFGEIVAREEKGRKVTSGS